MIQLQDLLQEIDATIRIAPLVVVPADQFEKAAIAAPVVDGIILTAAARPPFQSFRDGPSTVFWVAV